MTFAAPTILEVRRYLKGQDADLSDPELGIVGGPSHIAAGTSYHLGRDQLIMSRNPYSARTPRDRAGLSNASSALDVDDDLDELRELSVWVVAECRRGAPDTLDLREVIYSPDGVKVLRWDRERGVASLPFPDSDLSHRTHTHFSWYRDSEFRRKVGLFERFYAERAAGPQRQGEINMFFLKAKGDPLVYVSDGQNSRVVPGGLWDSLCAPLINRGVPLLEFATREEVLRAGGPERPPVAIGDEQLVLLADLIAARLPAPAAPPTPEQIAEAVLDEQHRRSAA